VAREHCFSTYIIVIFAIYSVSSGFSDERTDLLFSHTNVTRPCQRCQSRVEVAQNLRPYVTLSFETGFPFCRLLRLAGLRWEYCTRLHTGESMCIIYGRVLIWPRGWPNNLIQTAFGTVSLLMRLRCHGDLLNTRSIATFVCEVLLMWVVPILSIRILYWKYSIYLSKARKLYEESLWIAGTNSVAFSPQTNYFDGERTTGRRILVLSFPDISMTSGQGGGTHTVEINYIALSKRSALQSKSHYERNHFETTEAGES
jgi:hypothetical protein